MSMDNGTSDTDIGTPAPDRRYTPNPALLELRAQKGWSRPRLAREMENACRHMGLPMPDRPAIEKLIYRAESGRTKTPDDFYVRLFCKVYQRTAQELFGSLNHAVGQPPSSCLLRSHKFIPAYIGSAAVAELRGSLGLTPTKDQWFESQAVPVDYDGGRCALHVWPFGVAMFHLVEDLSLTGVAELAVFRLATYDLNMDWAATQLREFTGGAAVACPYVLSAYWVDTPIWTGFELCTALRLMCVPRALLEREPGHKPSLARAQLVERALLQDGFDHSTVVDFGIKGISYGLASWAGVVYHAVAPDRALAEDELVRCELAVQAIWAYCDYIRNQVERGIDPVLPDGYGWRFLRGVRSRLTTERPQETSQYRLMREAIIETSGLAKHLTQAVEILRETSGA